MLHSLPPTTIMMEAEEAEIPQLPFGLGPAVGEHFFLHEPKDYQKMNITGRYEVTIEQQRFPGRRWLLMLLMPWLMLLMLKL